MRRKRRLLEYARDEFTEEIIDSIYGVYESDLNGKAEKKDGLLLITKESVIIFSKGLMSKHSEVIPLNKINAVNHGKDAGGHHITIQTSSGKVHMKWVESNTAKFASQINTTKDIV